jgi:hypothetical protein
MNADSYPLLCYYYNLKPHSAINRIKNNNVKEKISNKGTVSLRRDVSKSKWWNCIKIRNYKADLPLFFGNYS